MANTSVMPFHKWAALGEPSTPTVYRLSQAPSVLWTETHRRRERAESVEEPQELIDGLVRFDLGAEVEESEEEGLLGLRQSRARTAPAGQPGSQHRGQVQGIELAVVLEHFGLCQMPSDTFGECVRQGPRE